MKLTVSEHQAGVRLDRLLVDALGIGRAGARRLFADGRVRVAAADGERQRRATKGDVAVVGSVIEIDIDRGASDAASPDASVAFDILLETPDILVADKPAGLPTAPLIPGELGTLANGLVARYPGLAGVGTSPREPGLIHRLDTDTSGLVVVARSAHAFDVLKRALKEGRIDKRYLLVCESRDLPEAGTIEVPLSPHPKDRRRVYPCTHPRDVARYAPRAATTRYTKLREQGPWALVEARAPKATRHQLRAHFAAIGHPLAGDTLYGGGEVAGLTRHALHAHHVAWPGDAVVPAFTVRSPLPPDLAALVGEVDV